MPELCEGKNFFSKIRSIYLGYGSDKNAFLISISNSLAARAVILKSIPNLVCRLSVLFCCAFAGLAHAEIIRMGGTGSAMPLMQKLADEYTKTHPSVQFEIIYPPLGSGGGLRALAAGRLDIAISSKLPPVQDQDKFSQPVYWVTTPFVLARRDVNRGGGLSLDQLTDIYSLKTTHWPDGKPIRLIMRAASETDSILLRSLSARMDAAINQTLQRKMMPVAEDDLDNLNLLESTPGSLGAASLGLLRITGSVIKPVVYNGIQPNVDALISGRYTLSKTLILIAAKQSNEATLAFVQYLQRPQLYRMLREWGYIPASSLLHEK